MLAIIIVVLTSLAIVAVAYSSYLSMLNSSNQMTKALEERRLLNDWTLSIQQAMRPFGIDRGLLVPNGQSVTPNDYLLPPTHINLQTKNAWGLDVIYCPFSVNKSGGTGTVKAGDGETYQADVITGSDGLEYIYSVAADADPTGTDLIAAIISPIPAETSPSCVDINYDSLTGDYYVPNYDGVVYPVTYSALVVSNQAKSVTMSDGGTQSLSEMVADWPSVLPDVLNINVASSLSTFESGSIDFINDKSSKSKSIIISGEGISQSIMAGTGSVINFNNVSVKISDIAFSDETTLNFINSDVTLENVVINNVKFDGSTVYASGNLDLVANAAPVEFINTELNGSSLLLNIIKNNTTIGLTATGSMLMTESISVFNNQNNGVGLIIGDSSSIGIKTALSSSGSYLDSVLSVASGGSINLTGTPVTISNPVDTFMFNQGDVSLSNLTVNFSSTVITGIILGLNSDTVLNQVQLGTGTGTPDVGVADIGGAKFIAGFNTTVGSTTACWSGDIFENVPPSSSGSTSEPLVTSSNKNSNRSVWTCSI